MPIFNIKMVRNPNKKTYVVLSTISLIIALIFAFIAMAVFVLMVNDSGIFTFYMGSILVSSILQFLGLIPNIIFYFVNLNKRKQKLIVSGIIPAKQNYKPQIVNGIVVPEYNKKYEKALMILPIVHMSFALVTSFFPARLIWLVYEALDDGIARLDTFSSLLTLISSPVVLVETAIILSFYTFALVEIVNVILVLLLNTAATTRKKKILFTFYSVIGLITTISLILSASLSLLLLIVNLLWNLYIVNIDKVSIIACICLSIIFIIAYFVFNAIMRAINRKTECFAYKN